MGGMGGGGMNWNGQGGIQDKVVKGTQAVSLQTITII